MNEKFYSLPIEKQQSMINAGYRVFSQNSYQKSPVREIADAAGISKSLLFHYFHNKKELYLFLWNEVARVTMQYLTEYGCYEPAGLFEMMERGMRAKLRIMEIYPDLAAFTVKAFYEKDPEIRAEIQKSYQQFLKRKPQHSMASLDPKDFIPGLNLDWMRREMYLAAEGYLWEITQRGKPLDIKKLERDFSQMIAFWKYVYTGKEETT